MTMRFRTLAAVAMAASGLTLAACGNSTKQGASEPREKTGQEVYAHWCADCHDAGPGHPGTLRLDARGDGNPVLLKRHLDGETVKYVVRNGIQMMPPFRQTEISDEELERLIQYMAKEK